VQEVLRGKEAWERIREQLAAAEPKRGFEYCLCRVGVGYSSRARGFARSGEPYTISGKSFIAVSSDGRTEFESPELLRQPQPELINTTLFPGDSKEGWVILEVPEAENTPFLTFRREYAENVYGVWGQIWFRLE